MGSTMRPSFLPAGRFGANNNSPKLTTTRVNLGLHLSSCCISPSFKAIREVPSGFDMVLSLRQWGTLHGKR